MTHSIQRIPFLSQIEDMEAYVSQYKDMKNNNNTNMIMNLNNAANNYNYNNSTNNGNSSYGSNQNHINNPSSSVMHTVQSYNNIHHDQQNNKNNNNNRHHHNHHNYHNNHSTDNNNNNNNSNSNHYQNHQNGYKGLNANHKNNNGNGNMNGGNGASMQSYGSQLQVQRSGGVLNPTSYSSLYLNNDMASAPNYLNVPAHFTNGIYNGSALDLESVTGITTPARPAPSTPLYHNSNGYDQLLHQRSNLVSPGLSTPDGLLSSQTHVTRSQPPYINDFYKQKNETGLGQSTSLYNLQNSMQSNPFDSNKSMMSSSNNNSNSNSNTNNNNNNNNNNNVSIHDNGNHMINDNTQGNSSLNTGKMNGLYSMNSTSPFASSTASFNDGGLYTGNQTASPFSYTQHVGASSTGGVAMNGHSGSSGQHLPLQQLEQLQLQNLQNMNQPQQQPQQPSGQHQFLSQQPNLQPFNSAGSSSGQLSNSSMLSPYNKIWSDNMSVWS